MRALESKIIALWEMRQQSEAINVAWRMLELNPNDNQGVRYILFDWLLIDNRLSAIPKLIKNYDDDPTAHWQYNKLLYFYKKLGVRSTKTKNQFKQALESNSYVPEYLTGDRRLPKDLIDSYAMRSKEEAIYFLSNHEAGK